MADVARFPGIAAQIRLVAGLRWRLLRNSLRKKNSRLDLLGGQSLDLIPYGPVRPGAIRVWGSVCKCLSDIVVGYAGPVGFRA